MVEPRVDDVLAKPLTYEASYDVRELEPASRKNRDGTDRTKCRQLTPDH